MCPRAAAVLLTAGVALACAGCDGPQSTLMPAGRDAERIARLFWWMAGGAVLIWTAVMGLAVYAIRANPGAHSERASRLLIVGGGAVVPTVVLGGLLSYGLALTPDLLAPGAPDGLLVEVSGEEWWWRVTYQLPDGSSFETANEIRLPVGERVELTLTSPDVIHAFWVPALAGKMDMIPGRTNRLALEPTRTGTFRGTCAEFCGAAHALMGFPVVVMEPAAFEAWLRERRAPARAPADAAAARGRELFELAGCGACHTVRGTPANGGVGPNLTHVGSRLTLGAGILPNDPDAFARWVADPEALKPGVHMPAFGMLPPGDLRALALYLESLQ